ncbi:MAG: anthranilate phosphoribosyltransferase [Bifidobacteriaceae bacterium]|jgi:anthranilate phosphoribosyltransferase|nr:anthranilate phosphoribosyltransferase [Bifidobacteriaceae bacterium]
MPEPRDAHAPTWPDLTTRLIAGADLEAGEAAWAMDEVMSAAASPVALAGFLVALRAKGETVAELGGLADAMLAHAVSIDVPGPAVDIVGTGGDRAFTVNISTMSAIAIAAAGVRVVKHGNRASSSRSGSADVLEALGVNLTLPVREVEAVAREVGIAFLFAQVFHPSMRHAAVARRELGVATVFNFLGPLTNPARPRGVAIGCADRRMAPIMAGVLAARGQRGLVFRGESDGLDELAATGPSRIWEIRDGEVMEQLLDGGEVLGLDRISVGDLRGGDAPTNADVARGVFAGQEGPVRQTVLFNAAAGIVAEGNHPGLPDGDLAARLRAGIVLAADAIDSGAAADLLDRWRRATAR